MTFNRALIEALWQMRNREDRNVRPWLRQAIRIERKRRGL